MCNFRPVTVRATQLFSRRSIPRRAQTTSLLRFLDHAQLRQTTCRTPLKEWSALRWDHYPSNIQQTLDTNIHALSGAQTREPRNWATAQVSLTSHGHQTHKSWVQIGIHIKKGICCWSVLRKVISVLMFVKSKLSCILSSKTGRLMWQ
jgi:hypothetical protein